MCFRALSRLALSAKRFFLLSEAWRVRGLKTALSANFWIFGNFWDFERGLRQG
jgi:hypothetical protein